MWSKKLTAPKRGESGMIELCREAYALYQDEVIKQQWIYVRFVEDFLAGHECCDAYDAMSINENARSLRTVKTLLWRRKDLVQRYFGMTSLTDEQIEKYKKRFDKESIRETDIAIAKIALSNSYEI